MNKENELENCRRSFPDRVCLIYTRDRNRESRCPQVLTITWVSETLHCLFGWRAHICSLTYGGIYIGLSVIEFMSNYQIIILTSQNKMIRPTCSSLIFTLMPLTSIYLSIKYLRIRHNYLIRIHNFLTSRHKWFDKSTQLLEEFFSDNYVDVSDMSTFQILMSTCHVDLSYIDVDFSDKMLICQIILFLYVRH